MSATGSPGNDRRGKVDAAGVSVAILVARFNADVTERLLDGAVACLVEHGAEPAGMDVFRVPGAWELPQTAAKVAALGRHDAILALGCVIRGETPHFDYVCAEANHGLGAVAREARIPVLFGVLTTHDREQAMARAGAGSTNKGYETALAALDMVELHRTLGNG